jgi:hypothetical protein
MSLLLLRFSPRARSLLPALALLAACGGESGTPVTSTATCASGCGGSTTTTGSGGAGGSAPTGTLSLVLTPGNDADARSLAFDGARYVYFPCSGGLCRVDLQAATPSVLQVAGVAGQTGAADGLGAAARFSLPTAAAWDGARYVYVADDGNATVRRVDTQPGASFGAVITLAGAAGVLGNVDALAAAARFQHPMGLAHDGQRYLYVAEWDEIPMGTVTSYAGTVRRVDTQEGASLGAVLTVAGDPAHAGISDGTGSAARLENPTGVAHDRAGHLYVSDVGVLRRVSTDEGAGFGAVLTVAGKASDIVAKSIDGVGPAARFVTPLGLGYDPAGWLYVADESDATVRRVDLRPGATYATVTTVVGVAGEKGDLELGSLATARLNMPVSVAWLGGGSLLVFDGYVHSLLRADGL